MNKFYVFFWGTSLSVEIITLKGPISINTYIFVSFFKGEEGFKLANELIGRALKVPGATVHWYDKPGQ